MYDESGNAILDTQENRYYNPSYTALPTYEAAQGGLMSAPFGNNMYPQSQQEHTNFATPTQMPTSAEVVGADYDALTNAYSGQEMPRMADGGIARDSSPTGNMSYPNGGAGWGYDLALKKLGMQNQQNPESQAESYQYTYDPATQTFNKAMPAPAVGNLGKKALPNMGAMSGASFGNGFNGLFGQLGSKVIPEVTSGGGNQYQYNQDNQQFTKMAAGGLSTLGGYSDGGRMLKGPGDGMSDDIPGVIGGKQPARLADGEFVVPADVVSHLGNGSTDAGAKRLYSMMDKVRSARTGTKKQGKQIKADKYLPA
jgi:hypothetical protein